LVKRVPGLRERVCLESGDEVYLVVWVDHDRQVADLIPLSGGLRLEEDVPWARLRPVALCTQKSGGTQV
jgi:hypothetical protein